MAMLEYNEIVPKKFIELDGAQYEVLSSHVFRKQMRKPVNQTKLKNLISGKVTERSFGAAEQAQEADLSTKAIKYLYTNRGQWWFCESNDPSKRFELPAEQVGEQGQYLKVNSTVEALIFNEKIIGLRLPIKVELLVKEAAPAVKGNTVQGAQKQVVLETGASLNVPMFVNEGDLVRINTETGNYVERVDKSK